MTWQATVNVIEGTGKYSAKVSGRWVTRLTDVPGGLRGARLTQVIPANLIVGKCAHAKDSHLPRKTAGTAPGSESTGFVY
jgi:hypothetical protein